MKTQIKALKVKIKSLAAEARIIRTEERRALAGKKPDAELYQSLRRHRRADVRSEARHALLAYGFLRGRDYRQVEAGKTKAFHRSLPPDWDRVARLVSKFEGTPHNFISKFRVFRVPELVTLLRVWAAGTPSPHKRVPEVKA